MDHTATRRYHVLLNSNSGTALAQGISPDALAESFREAGLDAVIDGDTDTPFADRVKRAIEADVDVIVAAGGDGTITALAGALAGTSKALAILPLGTVNAMAKDLGVPLDIRDAVALLATATPRQIDVGEVNGRIFLHKVVIGIVPSLAAAREHIRGHETLGAKLGFIRFALHRMYRHRRMAVAIEPDEGANHIVRAMAVAVACNPYDQGVGRVFARTNLESGTLTIYTLSSLNVIDFFRLAMGMVVGNWHQAQALSIETSQAVTIRSHKKLLKVMFDGEIESLETPLSFRIMRGALSVLVPTDPAAVGPEHETGTHI